MGRTFVLVLMRCLARGTVSGTGEENEDKLVRQHIPIKHNNSNVALFKVNC